MGGMLIIKKYLLGMCTSIELESIINHIEDSNEIKIDMVINDYADIMCPLDKSKQTRDSINEIYIYLKRIADDKKLLMITMSRINEIGAQRLLKTGKFTGRELAEDKRKFANVDKGIWIGIPEELHQYNEAVVGIFANREEKQGFHSVIGMNLDIGQFCVYNYV